MWLEWIEKFNEVLDRHAPLRSSKIKACTSKITARLPPKGTATYSLWLPLDDPGAETFNSSKTRGSPTADKRPFQFFIVLRRNATQLSRALMNRHFMDMCNEHSKSPRKLRSLLNSLTSTGRVKSHPPPRATLISLSETFAAIVSDPSRPVHLVQTAETETRCTSEPSQERRRLCQFSPVSVQMVQNLLQNIDSRKATGAVGVPGLLLKKCVPNLAPSLTAIFIASFAARTATGVQTGRHYPCVQVRRSGNSQ